MSPSRGWSWRPLWQVPQTASLSRPSLFVWIWGLTFAATWSNSPPGVISLQLCSSKCPKQSLLNLSKWFTAINTILLSRHHAEKVKATTEAVKKALLNCKTAQMSAEKAIITAKDDIMDIETRLAQVSSWWRNIFYVEFAGHPPVKNMFWCYLLIMGCVFVSSFFWNYQMNMCVVV